MTGKIIAVVLVVLGVIILYIGLTALAGWIFQMVWNGLAGFFHFRQIPYNIAVLIVIGLQIVGGFFKSQHTSK